MARSLSVLLLILSFVVLATACGEEPQPRDPGFGPGDSDGDGDGDSDGDGESCDALTDQEFCSENGFECGEHEFVDECEETRTVNCGDADEVCGDDEVCGSDQEGICGCPGETDAELCADEEYQCGPLTVTDSCGVEREIADCADARGVQCSEFETCEDGDCGCEPNSDAEVCLDAGYECGPLTTNDSCGEERVIEDCADALGESCPEFQTCGGGGDDGICGCTQETEEQLCLEAGIECGPLMVQDSCGESRSIGNCTDFGGAQCISPESCGGGGEDGICGCTPTSCEEEGILCGTIEDGCGLTLECDTFCAEQVAVGDQHACAMGSGAIKCWGRNNRGQLGVGDTSQRSNPADVIQQDGSLLQHVVSISTGTNNTCALFEDTSVRCWGLGGNGQLGVGSTVDSNVASSRAIFEGAVKIDTGESHSCALVVAIDPDDLVNNDIEDLDLQPPGWIECWGHNNYGQIGNPDLDYGATVGVPDRVHLPDGYVALDIELGANHSCALLQNEDDMEESVWCWGRNRFGQIESLQPNYDNYTDDPPLAFAAETNSASLDSLTRINQPTRLDYSALLNGTNPEPLWVSAGADYTCILDANEEEAFCWGVFTTPPRNESPCPVTLDMPTRAGTQDGMALFNIEPKTREANACSVLPDLDSVADTALTFPVIRYTLASNGTHNFAEAYVTEVANEPFRFSIRDSPDLSGSDADALSLLEVQSGANHLCAIIELPAENYSRSNVYCLGDNRSGQLGDGNDNSWPYARQVNRDVNDNRVIATQIALGLNLSCALMVDNNVKCWGSNAHGQIGNSALDNDNSFRPFDVRLNVAD